MPPGPPNLGDNRFALLSDGPQTKRKKTSKSISNFPELPVVQLPNPKFIVISTIETDSKKLTEYSCFAVHRALGLISEDVLQITELRDGNLLLLVNNDITAKKFLACKELPTLCKINCSYHKSLNFTKGTIYAPYLKYVPDEEIVKELSSQGVVEIYKFNKSIDGKSEPSGVILLTFDKYHLPQKLDICWHKVFVREYIPNPMRCRSCQLLGHTAKRCQNTPTCANCNLPPHPSEQCTRTYCANCAEPHPATSKDCKKFNQQKDILKIKTKSKCTMREAKEIYRKQKPSNNSLNPTFSSITSNNTNKIVSSSVNSITQNSSEKQQQIPNSENINISNNNSFTSSATSSTNNNLITPPATSSTNKNTHISNPSKNNNKASTTETQNSKTFKNNNNSSSTICDIINAHKSKLNTKPSTSRNFLQPITSTDKNITDNLYTDTFSDSMEE